MLKKPTVSRPPGQYVPADGTQWCLVANEYDRNTYAQCSFIGTRTLIRCRQIRSKDDLAKNNGICEEHEDFRQSLKRNHEKEVVRLKAECESTSQQPLKKKRYSAQLVAEEVVRDEDDWLQPVSDFSSEVPEQIYENALDDLQMRYAGAYTDKDILRMRIDTLKKDISDIETFRSMLKIRAIKRYETSVTNKPKMFTPDYTQQRVFDASMSYGRPDRLYFTHSDKTKDQKPLMRNVCNYGHVNEHDDQGVINDIIETLVCTVEGTPVPVPCKSYALPLAKYCLNHITKDSRQILFDHCEVCGTVTVEETLCQFHQVEFVRTRAEREIKRERDEKRRTTDKMNKPKNLQLQQEKVTKITIESSDDEEQARRENDKIMNLLKHAEMASPLPPLPSPHSSRRSSAVNMSFGQFAGSDLSGSSAPRMANIKMNEHQHKLNLVRKQLTSPHIPNVLEVPTAMVLQSTMANRHKVVIRKDETMKCARRKPFRERPFDRDHFGTILKKPLLTDKITPKGVIPQRPTSASHFRVLPSSAPQAHSLRGTQTGMAYIATNSASRPGMGRAITISGRGGHIQTTTRYMYRASEPSRPAQIRPNPVTIPLNPVGSEKAPESEEFVEDRKTPPTPQSPMPVRSSTIRGGIVRGRVLVGGSTGRGGHEGTVRHPTTAERPRPHMAHLSMSSLPVPPHRQPSTLQLPANLPKETTVGDVVRSNLSQTPQRTQSTALNLKPLPTRPTTMLYSKSSTLNSVASALSLPLPSAEQPTQKPTTTVPVTVAATPKRPSQDVSSTLPTAPTPTELASDESANVNQEESVPTSSTGGPQERRGSTASLESRGAPPQKKTSKSEESPDVQANEQETNNETSTKVPVAKSPEKKKSGARASGANKSEGRRSSRLNRPESPMPDLEPVGPPLKTIRARPSDTSSRPKTMTPKPAESNKDESTPPSRTPRAAAIAASHALVTPKRTPTSQSGKQDPSPTITSPLDMLAAVSEIERNRRSSEEKKKSPPEARRTRSRVTSRPKTIAPKRGETIAKSKKKQDDDEEEYEEEL